MIPEHVKEPFNHGRNASDLLFNFSVVLSCLKDRENNKVLDFAGGSGWVAEFLNRTGYDVSVVDIEPHCAVCVEDRMAADERIDPSRLHPATCDGHKLDFYEDNFFGNIVCNDSLHHMKDFDLAIGEMYRILEPGGRVSFSEPGAKHAESPETIAFLEEFKADDETWIERSIVIEEINAIATGLGFDEMRIRPSLMPSMADYSIHDWLHFSGNEPGKEAYLSTLISFNYESQVNFYFDKPE